VGRTSLSPQGGLRRPAATSTTTTHTTVSAVHHTAGPSGYPRLCGALAPTYLPWYGKAGGWTLLACFRLPGGSELASLPNGSGHSYMKSDPAHAFSPHRGLECRGATDGLSSCRQDVALNRVFPHRFNASLGPSYTARVDPNSDFSPNRIGVDLRAVLPGSIVGSSS
jgi:hypothetical protein